MSLLDIVGGMLGGQPGQQGHQGQQGQPGFGGPGGSAALIAAVIGMLASGTQAGAQGGGLAGLIEKFQANGMGDIANSWVGTGQNMPVSGDQLSQVLGQDQMSDLASKFGLSPGDLGTHLSQSLPQAVDQLTPGGQLPEGGLGGLGDLLSMLAKR